jgi:DNA-binding transcriptional MerR regulator
MERHWKVGELARATGLTVRTLHHYDEVGLMRPAARTAAGHRLYSAEDVRRLYSIVALRGLGFGLPEVSALLDGAESTRVRRRGEGSRGSTGSFRRGSGYEGGSPLCWMRWTGATVRRPRS